MTQLPFCDRSLCLLPFIFIFHRKQKKFLRKSAMNVIFSWKKLILNAISVFRYQAERLQIRSHLTQAKNNKKKTSWNKIVWIYWWFFVADKMLRLQKHMNRDRNKFQCFFENKWFLQQNVYWNKIYVER